MAGINLLGIKPHKVSRDLRGYSVLFYGSPKSGKTTIATKFPNHLLLAAEKGYNAIPGAMAQPINSWAEFKKVLRQLKDEEVKKTYSTIILDTVDILYDYCEKYVCANAKNPKGGFGVDAIGDLPFGKGYSLLEKEFDGALRSIVQMNYGLVLISHATDKVFKDESGTEYNKIVPTLDKRATKIVSRMADIIGYSRSVVMDDGNSQTILFMRDTQRYMAGSRFRYTPDYINFTYEDLVKAIADAVDKQAEEVGEEYFTDEQSNLYLQTTEQPDFDELMTDFQTLVKEAIESVEDEIFAKDYEPIITQIVERHLGRGNKVSEASREQVEAMSLIVDDLKDFIKSKKK